MAIKSLIVTIFGVAVAGGSVFLAKEYVLDTSGAAIASQEYDLVQVIVAGSDIKYGQKIERHMLSTQEWPRDAVPNGAYLQFTNVLPAEGLKPRRAKAHFFQGEVLLAQKLSKLGEKVTIVQKLGNNTRAMSIKVDAATAVGGFVTPGDFIDIVMTHGQRNEMRAVTILQNIRVIGVDQQSEDIRDQPEIARTITVEVTPEQGQRLALAQKAGTLILTLRTLEGVVDEPLDMVELRDLLQEKSPVEDGKKGSRITVRRGTTIEIVELN
jgi:pilus assembly protein CpaB